MSRLEQLVATVLSVDAGSLRDSDGPGSIDTWDSLNHIMLAAAIEEEFAVTLSADELIAVSSLGDFRRLLHSKGCDV
jgi:acyl carrier protein